MVNRDFISTFIKNLIVYEDNYLIVLMKPSNFLMSSSSVNQKFSSKSAAPSNLFDYCRHYSIATNPTATTDYLGMLHRIDRPVSGLVTFAKDASSAARISKDFRQRSQVEKRYLAVVPGDLTNVTEFSKLEGDLVKEYSPAVQDRLIDDRVYPSVLEFKCIRLLRSGSIIQPSSSSSTTTTATTTTTTTTTTTASSSLSLLDIRLLTGRKHQIRAQLSHLGHPIVGDTVYGYMHHASHPTAAAASVLGGVSSIALHGYLLSFPHPATRKKVVFTAEPPQSKPSSSIWAQLLSDEEDRKFTTSYIRQQAELLP